MRFLCSAGSGWRGRGSQRSSASPAGQPCSQSRAGWLGNRNAGCLAPVRKACTGIKRRAQEQKVPPANAAQSCCSLERSGSALAKDEGRKQGLTVCFHLLPAWQIVLPAHPGEASHKQMTTTCGPRILSIGLRSAGDLAARSRADPQGSPPLWDQPPSFPHCSQHWFPFGTPSSCPAVPGGLAGAGAEGAALC